MKFGIILSAGNQTRFKSATPKALVNVNGKILLEENILWMSKYCDHIFTICSSQNEHFFEKYNHIAISSGKGSGDAVLKALLEIKQKYGFSSNDTCFILWGDCLIEDLIYKKVVENYKKVGIVPCVFEEKPYVQIFQKQDNKIDVLFSKFGENASSGFHDLSIFYFNCEEILKYLLDFQNKIIGRDGNYVHKHGNEMEFLDVFNETDIKAQILEIKNYQDMSFNTIEQLKNIK